jgi:ankyrin repeat protein
MNEQEKEIYTKIRKGIRDGDVDGVMALMDSAQLKVTTVFGTWLHEAAKYGRLEIVKGLIAKGFDVNAQGGLTGGTAINLAASGGHLEIVKYLIDHGATLDFADPAWNPLFAAIYGGHTDIAKLLIDRGIDAKVVYTGSSGRGKDAWSYAKDQGKSDIANLLAEHSSFCKSSRSAR